MRGKPYHALTELEIFIAIAESGNFTIAAERLNMNPSSISKFMTRLEQRLGVRLMQRTTRNALLTEEGEFYLQRGNRLLADLIETEGLLTEKQRLPRGEVRITCSVPYSLHQIIPLLPLLHQLNPHIRITLLSTDAVVDLLAERCDIAIRIGKLQDSSLKARRIASSKLMVVAAPDYLKKYGAPTTPADLSQHHCLNFHGHPELNQWQFKKNAKPNVWLANGTFSAENGESVRAMVLAGGGIAQLSAFMISKDIAEGKLIPILESYQANRYQEIYMLHAGQVAARVRYVMDFIVNVFADKIFE